MFIPYTFTVHSRARDIAQQRARRAVYLPHEEDDDSGDDEYYNPYSRSRYLQPRQKQERDSGERIRRIIEAEQMKQQRERMQRMPRSRTESQTTSSSQPTKPRSPSPQTAAQSPPRAAAEPSPAATKPRSNIRRYSEVHNEAATKIQASYRIHRSLLTIKDLERQFYELKGALTLPTVLDFHGPEGIITVTVSEAGFSSSLSSLDIATPKLSYTANNYTIHAHLECLDRLLTKLDSVESWGESKVRKSRKAVVRKIEAQASEVEAYWRRAWVTYYEHTSAPAVATGSSRDDAAVEDETGAGVQMQHGQEQPRDVHPTSAIDEVRTFEEKENAEVQTLVVDSEDASPHRIDTSRPTNEHESDDDDNYIDALPQLPQLYHTDDSESSDSELDFETAEDVATDNAPEVKPASTVVVMSDPDSISKDHLSLAGDEHVYLNSKEMTVDVNVDSSLGEFVMVQQ